MTRSVPASDSMRSRMARTVQRLVVAHPEELSGLCAAFATLFCMFCGYTILRPIRDTMGVTSGIESLPYLFWGTFVAMLLLQPAYGFVTSRFRRTVFLPWIYGFFVLNLLGFYAWFVIQPDHAWIARVYYVWVSVFNFFIVAVFWSLMADVFTREQAGRLFGFIAAGASSGGLVGPLIASRLAVPLGTINLLPLSALFLALSVVFMQRVIGWQRRQGGAGTHDARADERLGGGVLDAFRQVVSSRYLLGIAGFVVLLSWAGTLLYLEQQVFVAHTFSSRDAQTRFFASVDFWVQAASLVTQVFFFGRLCRRFGHGRLLMSVPLLMVVGYALFALLPQFPILVAVLAVRRTGEYAITRPSRDCLFTVCTREEKYKAKSLIDTFVYRAGDATSSTAFRLLTGRMGLDASAIGWIGVVVCIAWLTVAYWLGSAPRTTDRSGAGG